MSVTLNVTSGNDSVWWWVCDGLGWNFFDGHHRLLRLNRRSLNSGKHITDILEPHVSHLPLILVMISV
jgi:hypothetical protein